MKLYTADKALKTNKKPPKTEPNYFLEGAQAFTKFITKKKYDPALAECPYPAGSKKAEQWYCGWDDALIDYKSLD